MMTTEIRGEQGWEEGLYNLELVRSDGSQSRGGSGFCEKQISLDKPILKIVTKVTKDEKMLHSIEVHFRDGTGKKLGKERLTNEGR